MRELPRSCSFCTFLCETSGLIRSTNVPRLDHRFGPNIFNAEVPPSKLRDVTVEAKQRAHSEVNRLMARQRRQIIGGGASGSNAEDAMSIVSSCSSFHMAGRDGGAADDGGDGDEEREAARCEVLGMPMWIASVEPYKTSTNRQSTAAAPAGSTRSASR